MALARVSLTLRTALWTPLPPKRSPPSRSSTASNWPVEAPEGTIARPKPPSSRWTSHSRVGLPRESRTSRATTSSMVAMGKPSCAAERTAASASISSRPIATRELRGDFRARLAAVGRADYRYAGTPQTASQEGAIMTDPAPRPRPVARWRVLALLAAAALLAGCELATGTVRTASQLQDAGIRNPNLQYNNGVATLRYDADPNPLEARTEQDRAAAIIWRNLPFRIDQITDIARRATLIAVAVALVLMVLVVVVIVLVLRAVRRRPTPQPAGAWPQGGAPQPWGQPGWGQPPPPGQQPWGQAPPPPPPLPWGQTPPQQSWGETPPGPPPVQPGPAEDRPAGAPRAEAPPRGPGDTQRLEPGPPPPSPEEERGPTPPS